jgi:hypothetical protein
MTRSLARDHDRSSAGPGIGVVGLGITVAGAVLVTIAFTALDWLKVGGNSTFGRIHGRLEIIGPLAAGVAKAYFSWLGWLTFGVVVAVAVLAKLPVPFPAVLRPLGVVLAVVAIGLTFGSIKLVTTSVPSYADTLRNQSLGFYLAIGGFLVVGVGALIGPRRGTGTEPASLSRRRSVG